MKNLRNITEKLLAELDNIKETQDKILNTSVDDELNKLLGIEKQGEDIQPVDISDTFKLKIATCGNKTQYTLQKQLRKTYENILDIAIELNNKIDKPFERLIKIQEAKEKDIINVKEFELLYQYNATSQAGLRGRLHDPLPKIQLGYGAKIQYKKVEIEHWIDNNM